MTTAALRIPLALVIALGLTVLPPAKRAAASITTPCRAPGRLLVADQTTAVTSGVRDHLKGTYACTRGRRARLLDAQGGLLSPTVRAGYVAYGFTDSGTSGAISRVSTMNLRTGVRQSIDLSGKGVYIKRVLIAHGRVAFWLGGTDTLSPEGTGVSTVWEVHRLSGAEDSLLDRSAGIDPASFAVSSTAAFWLDAGVARSAPAG